MLLAWLANRSHTLQEYFAHIKGLPAATFPPKNLGGGSFILNRGWGLYKGLKGPTLMTRDIQMIDGLYLCLRNPRIVKYSTGADVQDKATFTIEN